MYDEIKSSLNSVNSCYRLTKNNFSTHLQSNNMKIKIYINIILSAALHGCKTWSLTLRKGYRLRMFDNSVLTKIFSPNRKKVTEECRRLHNESLIICAAHLILFT